jgi:hypothetical protein
MIGGKVTSITNPRDSNSSKSAKQVTGHSAIPQEMVLSFVVIIWSSPGVAEYIPQENTMPNFHPSNT